MTDSKSDAEDLTSEEFFFVTPEAIAELKRIASVDNIPPRVRVTCKGGGCAGISLVMDFTQLPSDEMFDLTFDKDGIEFIVDVKSAHYVRDAILDFGGNLLNRGFRWTLPRSIGGCGCGTSFAF
jgi:iron-sulfur cluster assembly protein